MDPGSFYAALRITFILLLEKTMSEVKIIKDFRDEKDTNCTGL